MATSAPSLASARALAAPMPREPPVTRATLPESLRVMGCLHFLEFDATWICLRLWYRNRNYRNPLFPNLVIHGQASGLRGARDLRKSRGIAVICGSGQRARIVEGDRLDGGRTAGRADRPPVGLTT